MYLFGSGLMWATPTLNALGAAIANPTPILIGTLQDAEIEFKREIKKLYGQKKFPVSIAGGKEDFMGKAKQGEIYAGFLETVMFGQAGSDGLVSVVSDTTGTVIPATPYQITVTPPNSGTFDADLGVFNALTGKRLIRVAATPATGQYIVSAGVYTFAAADAGNTVYINYRYTAVSTTARKGTIQNLQMGSVPTFRVDFYTSFSGKSAIFTFNNCVADGLKLSGKNDDYTIPEFGYSAFADAAGNIGTWSFTE